MSCSDIVICSGKDGKDGKNGKNAVSLIPLCTRDVVNIQMSNDPKDYYGAFILASQGSDSIRYNPNGYDLSDSTYLVGSAFTVPSKGIIKDFAIHIIASDDLDLPRQTLTLNVQIVASKGLTDYTLKYVSGSKITFSSQGGLTQGKTFEKIVNDINYNVSPGDQVSVILWGQLDNLPGNTNTNLAVTGGITMTQKL